MYGQARIVEKTGVFSFARHSPKFEEGVHARDLSCEDLSSEELVDWIKLAVRTMKHETLHMFGFHHCIYFRCLMNGSNGSHDTAGRTDTLCPVCLRKFIFSVSTGMKCEINLLEKYREVLDSYEDICGKDDESSTTTWLRGRIAKLSVCKPCEEEDGVL